MKRSLFLFAVFSAGIFSINAQEILLSPNELYYDFLSLNGNLQRPYLNYRTLSDSVWDAENIEDHIWSAVNMAAKKKASENVAYKIYGPESFLSYNTKNPHGQNDGALWQGRGANLFFSGGARLELYGFELTLLPQFAYSQNKPFELVPPAFSSGEAAKYGYYGYYNGGSVDSPQRFGDSSYREFSWGDSEIRYSWETLTLGFGTQNIWLGPARINPVLHSNNAPPYPKLDIGLRRQPITVPWINSYIGDIEIRAWWGYLSESDYFDTDSTNNHNLITGFVFAYAPSSLLKGLTVGINRIMLSKWSDADYKSFFSLLQPSIQSAGTGTDERDQRLTIVFDYVVPMAGFEVYFEWGRNDFPSNINYVIRDPFDSEAYTFGILKNLIFNKDLQGRLLFEVARIESHRITPQSFYVHHVITQGHTNRGQWLGAGVGTGGNSQYLGFALFYKKGYCNLFIERQGIDGDYVRYPLSGSATKNRKAVISIGVNNYINLLNNIGLFTEIVYSDIFNPTYNQTDYPRSRNFYFSAGLKFVY
jgi:hypothetical protein